MKSRQSKEILDGQKVRPDILPVGSSPVKHQIAFNAIPQIDKFTENGYTLEEMKMVRETKNYGRRIHRSDGYLCSYSSR